MGRALTGPRYEITRRETVVITLRGAARGMALSESPGLGHLMLQVPSCPSEWHFGERGDASGGGLSRCSGINRSDLIFLSLDSGR